MRVAQEKREQYLSNIGEKIVCQKKTKHEFLKTISHDIDEILEQNPSADFDYLQQNIGTPEEIANNFLGNSSVSEIKKRTAFSAWLVTGVAAVVLFAMVFCSAVLIGQNSPDSNLVVMSDSHGVTVNDEPAAVIPMEY